MDKLLVKGMPASYFKALVMLPDLTEMAKIEKLEATWEYCVTREGYAGGAMTELQREAAG